MAALYAMVVVPASATMEDTITCVATAMDPDGGSPTVTYAWLNLTRQASWARASRPPPWVWKTRLRRVPERIPVLIVEQAAERTMRARV